MAEDTEVPFAPNVTSRKLDDVFGANGGLSCGLTTCATTKPPELVPCCASELALAAIWVCWGRSDVDDVPTLSSVAVEALNNVTEPLLPVACAEIVNEE